MIGGALSTWNQPFEVMRIEVRISLPSELMLRNYSKKITRMCVCAYVCVFVCVYLYGYVYEYSYPPFV